MIAIISFLAVLSFLVLIHELGHALIAWFFGVTIKEISVGFGRKILSFKIGSGTEVNLRWILLGGVVKFWSSHDSQSMERNNIVTFDSAHYFQKVAVYAAGPVINLIVGFICILCAILMYGETGVRPVVNEVIQGGMAYNVGMQKGDVITHIDGIPVKTVNKVVYFLHERIGETGSIIIKTSGAHGNRDYELKVFNWLKNEGHLDVMAGLGLKIGYEPSPIIGLIEKGSPAYEAGILPGDQIVSINGKDIHYWSEIKSEINNQADLTPIQLWIAREKSIISTTITPALSERGKTIGIDIKEQRVPDDLIWKSEYSIGEATLISFDYTAKTLVSTAKIIGKFLTGSIGIENSSSFIGTAAAAGTAVEYGLKSFIVFVATLSVGMFVLNLLPLSMLDGGQILFLSVEKLTGIELSLKTQNVVGWVSVLIIGGLISIGLANDLYRL